MSENRTRAHAKALAPEAPMPPTPFVPHEDCVVLPYKGHGRQWKDSQLMDVLHFLSEGHSIEGAARLAGIPRRSLYRAMETVPDVREAVVEVYNHEGTDWWEQKLHDIAFGKGDPRATRAIITALRLRGRL